MKLPAEVSASGRGRCRAPGLYPPKPDIVGTGLLRAHASLPRGHARASGQQDKRIVDYDGDRLNGCAAEFSSDTIGRNRDAAAFHW
jgi:hypothetical protein